MPKQQGWNDDGVADLFSIKGNPTTKTAINRFHKKFVDSLNDPSFGASKDQKLSLAVLKNDLKKYRAAFNQVNDGEFFDFVKAGIKCEDMDDVINELEATLQAVLVLRGACTDQYETTESKRKTKVAEMSERAKKAYLAKMKTEQGIRDEFNAKRTKAFASMPGCPHVPRLEFAEAWNGAVEARACNHEWHDNGPRLDYVARYVNALVLPRLDETVRRSLSRDVREVHMEVHDSYTYLVDEGYHDSSTMECSGAYTDMLAFAGPKDGGGGGATLVPDAYFMANWGLPAPSTIAQAVRDPSASFEAKADVVSFCGTTTGARRPSRNRRLAWCVHALDHGGCLDFKITRVAQMREEDIEAAVGRDAWARIFAPRRISEEAQMANKFLMNVEGNTCRFDVWPYLSKSVVLVDREARDRLFYHDSLHDRQHHVLVDMDDIAKVAKYYACNPREARQVAECARRTASSLFTPETCARRWAEVLEGLAADRACY